MYPQSLHTHSPSQYIAAFASSSAFCAAVFLFPKTFRLVDDSAMVLVGTLATDATGLNAAERLIDAKSIISEQTNLITEFMVIVLSELIYLVGYVYVLKALQLLESIEASRQGGGGF